ncbi:MAG: dipeptidase [Candidatus Krumholzibacteria bacterium]
MKRILPGSLALILIGFAYFFSLASGHVDRLLNRVEKPPPTAPSEEANRLHERLFIADLHCDALLWQRDLLKRARYGHVDVPRLIEANVALQAFSVATKVPWRLNYNRNTGRTDVITLLVAAQRGPRSTWFSLSERALHQAREFHEAADRSAGRLVFVETSDDLRRYLIRREQDRQVVAGILTIEGLHALDGELDNIDALYEAGFRVMGPTHFFDNELGGSAHGVAKGGLTEFGRRAIERMEKFGIILDLAHASPRMVDDILDMAKRPVLISHTGVKGTCDHVRNVSDEHIVRIACTGGVIGIGFWEQAVCGTDAASIVRAIRHVSDLVGVDHVALGSDFDGAIRAIFDVTGLARITDALLADRFTEDEIRKIMGANILRLFMESLPER